MKYKLNERFERIDHEAGHVFETDDDGYIWFDYNPLTPSTVELFVKTGILSKVEEPEETIEVGEHTYKLVK